MYKLLKDGKTNEISGVLKDENIGIPMDAANTDYQEYLKWVAEGNTPTPADE
jgi:hypothetical protein